MAPYTGALQRSLVPYSGEQVWGTGANPIHELYGSPPLRTEGYPLRQGEHTPPAEAVPEQLNAPDLWGYTIEDTRNTTVFYDDRPDWGEQPPQFRGDADDHPPYNSSQTVNENFRSQKMGAHRYRQKMADSLPSETVSEGWRNKPKGDPANAQPSDPSQYEMQTSMTQREKTRVNDAAVSRGTDASRSGIMSRIVGQKLKIYSGMLRHYDMFPRQQDTILRPFSYRTAGTGQRSDMLPNAMFTQYALQRVPPPDPFPGPPETELTTDYGYTPEDIGAYY